MKLSVVVCTYRRFDWLRKCLSSLRGQILPSQEFATIVVDNSLLPDQSEAFRDSLLDFTNLEYIITEKSGLSYARNVALERCETPYIAFIDDDAIAHPNWAEEIIKAFERHGGAGVIGGRVLPIWEISKPRWLEDSLLHCQAVVDWGDEDVFISDEGRWLVGANVSYRAEALRKVGGFPSSLGRQGEGLLCHEELSVNLALQRIGFDIVYTPKAVVDHLVQAERMTQEWLFRQKYWEGASRALLERIDDGIDSEGVSQNLGPALARSLKDLPVFEDLSSIEMKAAEFQAMGRKACLDFMRVDAKRDCPQRREKDSGKVFYIVTPCLNAVSTIDQTVLSVFSQAGSFSIRYHIQDGGSSDGTTERLLYWQHRLSQGHFPLQCNNVVFTFATEPDSGMYDAITKAFSKMGIPPQGYMTWVNADDMLMPGALAVLQAVAMQLTVKHVEWLGGSVAVFKDDFPVYLGDRPLPTAVIKSGLCDGIHWDYVQQEGTFFSGELWLKSGAAETIRNLKFAGDYYLWRLFAQHARFYQLLWPLGAFRLREGQISQKHFDAYQNEIDAAIDLKERLKALKSFASENVTRLVLKADYASGIFRSEEENVDSQVVRNLAKILERPASGGSLSERADTLASREDGQPTGLSSEGPQVSVPGGAEKPILRRKPFDAAGMKGGVHSEHVPNTTIFGNGPDPNEIVFGTGWHPLEMDGESWWRWSSAIGYVHLKTAQGGKAKLSFTLRSSGTDNHVRLKVNGVEKHIAKLVNGPEMSVFLQVKVRPGTNVLEFSSDDDPVISTHDPRPFNFMVKDLKFIPPNRKAFTWALRKAVRKLERSGLFYVPFYLELVPEIKDSGLSPAEHYLRYGAWENKDPNPLFSSSYYLRKNRDVYVSGENPLLHYVERGAGEGRDPHPAFSTHRYLSDYPEVKEAGMNPLFHYLRYGTLEGRNLSPAS